MNLRTVAALLCVVAGHCALAGDPVAGEAIAESCVACHGAGGANPISNYPILAGQHESYLYRSLLSYKDASRNNAVMIPLLAEFSTTDLKNLAAYFAAQPSKLR